MELLEWCVGLIDCTILGNSQQGEYDVQHEHLNGQKRKQALKVQTVTTPDGIILQGHGYTDRCGHNSAL